MLNTGRAVQALVAQVSELTTQVQLLRSPAAPPTPPSFSIPGNHSPQHEPRLPAPEMYAGDPNLCRAFLTKCSLFFSLQPLTFATEVSRVALVLTLLSVSGPTIRILNIFSPPNVLTPGRLVGHYFSDVLIFPSPIGRVLKTSNPMPCHAFLTFRTARCLPSALYLRDWLSLQSLGRSNRRSARPWKG